MLLTCKHTCTSTWTPYLSSPLPPAICVSTLFWKGSVRYEYFTQLHAWVIDCVWRLLNSHCWPFQRYKYSVISCTDKRCGLSTTSWHLLHCRILVTRQATDVVFSKELHCCSWRLVWPVFLCYLLFVFFQISVISSALNSRHLLENCIGANIHIFIFNSTPDATQTISIEKKSLQIGGVTLFYTSESLFTGSTAAY